MLHGRILDAPVNISAWRQGRAALDAFDSYLSAGERTSSALCLGACVARTAEAAATVVARRAAAEALERRLARSTGPHAPLACDVVASTCGFAWQDGTGDAPAPPPLVACEGLLLLPSGSLTVLQGGVAAGKSTLLYGLLGEAKLVHGSVKLRGIDGTAAELRGIDGAAAELRGIDGTAAELRGIDGTAAELRGIDGTAAELRPLISLVGQTPWLLAASIRENICLGASGDFDADRYAAACAACALAPDLAALENGDAEHVGENGERLSGGQRQRVCLARAAYSRSPLVLLDDALSALDAHVAMRVFDECICEMMAGRTRLLISHSLAAAACADQVLKVGGGVVAIEELTHATARAYARRQPVGDDAPGRPAPHVRVREAAQSLAAVGIGATAGGAAAVGVPVDQAHAMGARSRSSATSEPEPLKVGAGSSAAPPTARGAPRLIRHAVAGLRRRLRGMALLARGVTDGMDGRCAAVAFCVLLLAETISVEGGVYLLAAYAEESTARAKAADPPSSTLAPGDDAPPLLLTYPLLAYAASVGLEAAFAYARSGLVFVAAHRGHARLQARLLGALMAADQDYFECTPSASVQQLFASDLEASDLRV